ncbi:MAG TPA: VOC family protein [Caulobacteraceae bacterium]
MAGTVRHFSINADDVPRAKSFYESVFGWSFEPWGPPDFYLINNAGVGGALQGRHEIKPGVRMLGFEVTMAVADIDATLAAVEAAGGKIIMRPHHIETVGTLIWFEDTEGNFVGAMKFDRDAAD